MNKNWTIKHVIREQYDLMNEKGRAWPGHCLVVTVLNDTNTMHYVVHCGKLKNIVDK